MALATEGSGFKMDSMISADLVSMLADEFFTVKVSIGSASTRGILDQLDEMTQDPFGKDAQVRSTVVTIKNGTLGSALVVDAPIVVNGVSYKVRLPAVSDDGLLQHIKVA